MIKVLHAEPARYDADLRGRLESVADVAWMSCEQPAFDAALAGGTFDAVFLRIGLELRAPAIAAAECLRVVVTPSTGLDHIDVDALAERGIELISLKGQEALLRGVSATAEHTWALLLAVLRELPTAVDDVRVGRWEREGHLGTELRGRTLGVIGIGRLGSMVVRYGLAFGMQVLVQDVDPSRLDDLPEGVRAVGLDALLASSDVVTLHVPLDSSTTVLLDAARVRRMRPGAVLVNTSRGELVDEGALVEALRSGRLGGLGADVVTGEANWNGRVPSRQEIVALARTMPNVVVTPHIGGFARDAVRATRRHVTEAFLRKVDGLYESDPHR
jgi:D-3-phosphoglycerate dehydrogenase